MRRLLGGEEEELEETSHVTKSYIFLQKHIASSYWFFMSKSVWLTANIHLLKTKLHEYLNQFIS